MNPLTLQPGPALILIALAFLGMVRIWLWLIRFALAFMRIARIPRGNREREAIDALIREASARRKGPQ